MNIQCLRVRLLWKACIIRFWLQMERILWDNWSKFVCNLKRSMSWIFHSLPHWRFWHCIVARMKYIQAIFESTLDLRLMYYRVRQWRRRKSRDRGNPSTNWDCSSSRARWIHWRITSPWESVISWSKELF
jgi:hypothetical protein